MDSFKKNKLNIICYIFCLIFSSNQLCAQNSNPMSLEFSCIKEILPNGDTAFFRIFYVIDSTKFIVDKGKKYFRFCFSESKVNTDGYVRIDRNSESILFISKFRKEKNFCKKANKVQKIFGFKKFDYADVCYLGALGSVKVKRINFNKQISNNFIFGFEYAMILGSHEIRIENIEFDKSYKPCSILVYIPFFGKKIKILSKQVDPH